MRVLTAMAFSLAACVLGACESPKPKVSLAPEKKAELERLFFNQMVSIHYGTSSTNPFAEKKAYLQSLAGQGLELADIALQITRSVGGDIRAQAPYQRLHELALQGDLGAKCFYRVHLSHFDGLSDNQISGPSEPPAQIQAWRFIQEGAAAGHPACKAELAQALIAGDTSLGLDVDKGRQLALEAGDAGYLKGYWTLFHMYQGTWREKDNDDERSLCWETKALKLNVPFYSAEPYERTKRIVDFLRSEGKLSPSPKKFDSHCQYLKD